MEQQNVQMEEGISLLDILRLLLSKIKLLILVCILGGILGGSFAVWRTYDINYWGTTVEFYVNPEKPKDSLSGDGSQYGVYGAYGRHVMDNMVKLLQSESFAERMLLQGDKLPKIKDNWATPDEERKLGLKTLIENAEAVKIDEKEAAVDDALAVRKDAAATLNTAESNLNEAWRSDLKGEYGSYFNQEIYDTLNKTDKTWLVSAYTARELAKTAYETANENYENKLTALNDANETVKKAITAWRKTAKYNQELTRFKSALSFSYLRANEDADDANNLARSFIYVRISTLNDEATAKEALRRVLTVVPEYVKEKMIVPADYQGTNCESTATRHSISLTNPRYTTNQAIKLGMLGGVAALLIACVIIIMLDRSDKRLRDTEVIAKKFNVPLLGVVPSIEELKTEQSSKKEGR